MSEPLPPEGGGGNFLTNRFLNIPVWVWLVIAAIAAFFIVRHFSGSSVPPTTGGGGGSAAENVTLQKGAVTIDITANDQPKPPTHRRRGGHHKHMWPPVDKHGPPIINNGPNPPHPTPTPKWKKKDTQ